MKNLIEYQEFVDSNPVWHPPSIKDEPRTQLVRWRVYEVTPTGLKIPTVHFVGDMASRLGEGRVSSAIIHFDKKTQVGKSTSGRIYELVGDPEDSISRDAEYTWGVWINRVGKSKVVDVTKRYKK